MKATSRKTPKQRLLNLVEQFPDDVNVEEAMERLYFLAKAEKGLEQADAGVTVPRAEAKKRLLGE